VAANLSSRRVLIADPKGLPVSRTIRLRSGVAAVALALGASLLTGCAAGQIAQTADQVPGVDGGQGSVGKVAVHNALLATPDGPNYPKGSDAPLTLWISNDASSDDTLTSISTSAGTVKIDGKATVPARSIIEVGGDDSTLTATVTGLTEELKYGISVPMTFTFAHAGALTVNIPLEIPKERVSSQTTNIYPEEQPNLWQTNEPHPSNLTSPAPTASG
jgi:copper(I)-binding protein